MLNIELSEEAKAISAMTPKEQEKIMDEFVKDYAQSLNRSLGSVNNMYNPNLGNNMVQSMTGGSFSIPSSTDIERWLKQPDAYSSELRKVSQYYEQTIMQYQRSVDHFKKILTFRYDLRLQQSFKTYDEETKASIINAQRRCGEFLRDFDMPYHTSYAMDRAIVNGGAFFYFQNNEDFKSLIEMPIDYCYITGRWDRGFTYAVDLSFFDKFAGLQETMPEMYEYYKIFADAREVNLPDMNMYQYYAVPVESSFVLTFGTSDSQMIPPLTGTFRDATAIFTYKNLLMQKTALDTWKVIAQEIPLNKDNVPILNGKQAQIFVDFAQQVLPEGTANFATPMKVKEIDLSGGSATQNNIVGRGEELFWRSAGINGTIMDSADKSSATARFSLMNDEGFVEQIYRQFEAFINLQLRLVSKTIRFGIKLYGNRYLEDEQIKVYKDVLTTSNGLIGKFYGLMGYEPFEVEPNLQLESMLGYKELLVPIIAGYQQTNPEETGAKKKELADLTQSGLNSRDDGE